MWHDWKVYAQSQHLWQPLVISEEVYRNTLDWTNIVYSALPTLNLNVDDNNFGCVGRLLAPTLNQRYERQPIRKDCLCQLARLRNPQLRWRDWETRGRKIGVNHDTTPHAAPGGP